MELFSIPVIYKESKHDRGVRILLPLEHLLFLRVIGKCIHFYGIHRREYTLQSTLQDWRILLDGTGFEEVDRGVLANARKIDFIFSDLQQIHFGAEAEGVFCPIARVNIPRLQKYYPEVRIIKSGTL
ncbi:MULTISPECIES: LytTR family transcriptional regulator DNA-binding domain-containing protein [Cohnella]|uniref:LytTR family transcriptional regulator DNA-binding domain-containing protein n=1 Tax=Cohnella TaxID=329857 RepID=UPI0009BB3027|nr:LytTR family transcriptional regulator DNA-binding domain-containing protein [Cohnella algarum]